MPSVIKNSKGEYILTRSRNRNVGQIGKSARYDWFWVKDSHNMLVRSIYFPKELIGKRVRFKLEIVD